MQKVESNQRKTQRWEWFHHPMFRMFGADSGHIICRQLDAEVSTVCGAIHLEKCGHRSSAVRLLGSARCPVVKVSANPPEKNGLLRCFLDCDDPPTMQSTTPRINRCFWHSKGDPEATQSQPPSIVLFGSSPNLTLEFQRFWQGCSIFVGRDWNIFPLKSWSIGHG